ncbi:MAG: TIGR02117 family protein [Alysiella sp.]|uniref:TIGR02117 family protein n=1 Tax=Alysiella sp. TaxID=1872483 RepID=UPI0026DBEE12|nr:TIGR02117 family protein [Alysiella sp.]MDO4433591.1 TIGR02117 family protein [Alysiella sp.]
MKKIILSFLGLLVGLLSSIVVYLLSAYYLGKMPHNTARDPNAVRNIPIFIISNGVHTDIAMPMSNQVFNWHHIINPKDTQMGQEQTPKYVAIGWGDRGFYLDTPTWADLKFSTAFYAITGLNQTALHISYYFQEIGTNENIAKIMVSPDEYQKLVHAILPSFKLSEKGTVQAIPNAHYANHDAFYEANGHYHLAQTCNTWTNSRLKMSGLPAVKWTPFAKPLIEFHKKNQM